MGQRGACTDGRTKDQQVLFTRSPRLAVRQPRSHHRLQRQASSIQFKSSTLLFPLAFTLPPPKQRTSPHCTKIRPNHRPLPPADDCDLAACWHTAQLPTSRLFLSAAGEPPERASAGAPAQAPIIWHRVESAGRTPGRLSFRKSQRLWVVWVSLSQSLAATSNPLHRGEPSPCLSASSPSPKYLLVRTLYGGRLTRLLDTLYCVQCRRLHASGRFKL